MGNLSNVAPIWEPEIHQSEPGDDLIGGPTGEANISRRQLASRTAYLKAQIEAIEGELAGFAAKVHGHVIDDVEGLVEAIGGRALSLHGHSIADVELLQAALDAMHKRSGNEVHQGKFKVTGAPVADEDVIRLKDLITRVATPFASMVQFWVPVPDAFGSPAAVVSIGGANSKFASGHDIRFVAGDATLLEAYTAGFYEFLGEAHTHLNIQGHDIYVEIWQRPAGTTGASDKLIYAHQDGGYKPMTGPLHAIAQAAAGDRFYFKGVGRRSLGVAMRCAFLGAQASTQPLTVPDQDWTGMAANGQVYPKIVTLNLRAQNATGLVSWEITGGTLESATTLEGAVATVSIPAAGAHTLIVRATDALGIPVSKTINLTLSAYALTTVVIGTSTPQAFVASAYPFEVDIALTSTGGELPIAWSVVAGVDTDLPSAAITGGNRLTGAFAAAGTKTAKVRATDAAGSPQVVDKIITINVTNYEPPPGGSGDIGWCFEAAGTFVLMANGTGKRLLDVLPGDQVLTVSDYGHRHGLRSLVTALVTDKTLREGDGTEPESCLVHGIKATPGHPFAHMDPDGLTGAFARADALTPETALVQVDHGQVLEVPAGQITRGDRVQQHANLGTTKGTFCVSASPTGPWLLVHNIQFAETMSY